jgi:hypothetical protein
MAAIGSVFKSRMALIARALFAGPRPPEERMLPPEVPLTAPPEKTGYPPSKCYGNEINYHCDSW